MKSETILVIELPVIAKVFAYFPFPKAGDLTRSGPRPGEFLFLHNEFWGVAWGSFPSICSRICVLASRIVELSCFFGSARGLWKVIFQVSDAIRVQAAPGGPFLDF